MEREILNVENIYKSFGNVKALKGVSFSVKEGEIFFLLGPSGCGKTTLLRIIAGFESPDRGNIFLQGKDITKMPPNKRNIGMVFQNYALWPHMNVWENVAYGLKIRKLPESVIEEKVESILKLTDLYHLKDKFPSQLSGGQQQRVALSRSLVIEPDILLLDEPLSNLDAKLRERMREEIKSIQRKLNITMLYVTHDQKEAISLADRICILNDGEVLQIGTPMEIYFEPENKFVANFIGKMNFLKGEVAGKEGNLLKVKTEEGDFFVEGRKASEKNIEIGFRPELIRIGKGNVNNIGGEICEVNYLGETVEVKIKTKKGKEFIGNFLFDKSMKFKKGDFINFYVSPQDITIFEK